MAALTIAHDREAGRWCWSTARRRHRRLKAQGWRSGRVHRTSYVPQSRGRNLKTWITDTRRRPLEATGHEVPSRPTTPPPVAEVGGRPRSPAGGPRRGPGTRRRSARPHTRPTPSAPPSAAAARLPEGGSPSRSATGFGDPPPQRH
ncbi:hypothetical protein QJS66_23730 (plasmid) [Kocuria rhizophila]|nr:hypothetical protein QJS66_23730 [Kocuria rhizophila]